MEWLREWAMSEYLQAITTVPSMEEAVKLARSIASERLAACVQIVGPIRSVYWWQGQMEDAQEWQLLIKTTAALFPTLETHIKANHSYDTPEIIAMHIIAGSPQYLAWISHETRRTDASS
ncbi:divalent-cation tolerance protein CutA [Sphaerisporangium rhizosphaerae]|uniref:Divalent-cation tolerance protein CutA n=1 Tax=Sphaerisporangium rhizosphaerae TaxID=2269375 RepID=A0ABW2P5S4_9ACTN